MDCYSLSPLPQFLFHQLLPDWLAPHYSTETSLLKVTYDLPVAKCSGYSSVLILHHLSGRLTRLIMFFLKFFLHFILGPTLTSLTGFSSFQPLNDSVPLSPILGLLLSVHTHSL